ncbi:MAG TPA: Hpt domain-containing protein [Xanthobacteraceae bacterium]|nr:Hpt domain-containing protein [Xanthobacteraceae bacterium]
MQSDPFAERLAKVRRRFASTLAGKIDASIAALPKLSCAEAASVALVADAYQEMHRICGVAPTVGFTATGKAARGTEDVLIAAFRGKRALSGEEAGRLQEALARLKAAASDELLHIDGGGADA